MQLSAASEPLTDNSHCHDKQGSLHASAGRTSPVIDMQGWNGSALAKKLTTTGHSTSQPARYHKKAVAPLPSPPPPSSGC